MTVIRKQDIARRMRQVLQSGREARREITLQAKYPDDASCLDASGAIRLTIRDFMPELVGNDVLPPGLELDYGVDSTEVWPVSINDVEIEEEDEVGELTDQSLGFAQIRGVSYTGYNMAGAKLCSADAADHVHLVISCGGEDQIGLLCPRLYQGGGACGAAKHANYIQRV